MNTRIVQATLLDENHELHGKKVDLRIENGTLTEIGTSLSAKSDEETLEFENLMVSTGWFDSSVSMGEPGYEERETLKNGLEVAAKSGFTAVAVNPNTRPVADDSSVISYLKNKSAGHAVDLYPIGALTQNGEGVDLAELYDMQQAGAVAFGDYQHAIKNPNLLKLALQYTQGFDGLVLSFPQEDDLVIKGMANEGETAIKLGLKGIPALAEHLQIARDLYLLEYAGGKLHIPTVSTAQSVALIKAAKEKGLDVTCSVAISNLFFIDAALEEFDTRFKVLPPLRTDEDRKALIAGLEDGTIDMVTSDHNPLDIELKKLEFDHAKFGTIAQEATLGALLQLVSPEVAVKALTNGRERFTGNKVQIKTGNPANLTLFTTEASQVFTKEDIRSKSKNAAFLGAKLKGKVYGIIANNQFIAS
ncbi:MULTISPECIES: dihydroorotase family protein [unclassified Leeuwenhoekiella]|uniref:dihydroorotase n=1 Tax=unclassified Leeuwenhoekiella TaxID=2615029 RepID=UPI000C48AD87|nr:MULTISPECIES: dihydroorotase [unclassified Leeuwenhoekiella]MAW94924.1 dihydroorotase [Leeuwenhoekiella sp.]MBA79644.1 dihydroorotase [Leeuwenhoekiella sp.]|tara:strand:- start:1143 stop:2396 length:1254 start_codon:yes stop_codon:yes gene_type:complete